MNFNIKDNKTLVIFLPAIAAFLLALIPTIQNQWPLSWDITYHIQYAQTYAQYGFTLTDPLLNSPYGQKIGYPPVFHFLIAGLGTLFHQDFFQVARALQPVLASLIILSVSYVGYRLHGALAGASAGFLMFSSALLARIVLPLPENLALIFLPIAVLFFYQSLEDAKLRLALISGLLLLIVLSIHTAAFLCLFIIILAMVLVELLYFRNLLSLKNFGVYLSPLVIIVFMGLIGLIIFYPDFLKSIFEQGISAVTGMSTSVLYNRSLSLNGYYDALGPLVLVMALLGGIWALIRRQRKDLTILVWILAMLLLANASLIGVNMISYRVLIYMLIPLSMLGGFGLSQLYYKLGDMDKSALHDKLKGFEGKFKGIESVLSSKSLRASIVVIVLAIALYQGFVTVDNPKISVFGVKNQYGTVQISQPSEAQVDLAQWLNDNANKSRSFVIANPFVGMFLVTQTGMPMNYAFDKYSDQNARPPWWLEEHKIGYIIYDKRLVTNPQKNKLALETVESEFYPLFYFTKDIKENLNQIKPDYARVVYENQEFTVCEV